MTALDFFTPGFIFGFLAMAIIIFLCIKIKRKEKTCIAGTMVINTTDPKKDIIRFELDIPISEMFEKDRVTFVVTMEDESQ